MAVGPRRSSRLAVAVALFVGTVLVYVPACRLGFVNYDDQVYVTENPHVLGGLSADDAAWAFTTGDAANYHPLTWLSLQADATAYGLDPSGYHVTNVVLHGLTAAGVYLLLTSLTGAGGAAAVAAAGFAVHPVHVESVAWVAERKDVLSGLFSVLTMWAYVGYARRPFRAGAYAGVCGLFLAATLAKPTAVTVPFVLMVLDRWPLGLRGRRAVRDKVPLLAIAAVGAVTTAWAQSAGGAVETLAHMPAAGRAENVVVAYARYLRMFLWPTGLSVFYPYRTSLPAAAVAGAVAVLGAITTVAVRLRRSRPYLLVGWLIYLGMLVPTIGVVQVGWQSRADRYLYVPMVGLLLMAVWAGRDLVRGLGGFGRVAGRVAGRVLAGAAVAAMVRATWHQIGYWTDTRTLFERSLAVDPDNAVAHVQLAYLAEREHDRPRAIREYTAAIAFAPAGYVAAEYNLGNLLLATDPAAAAAHYRTVLATSPGHALAENNLGVALERMGRPTDAMAAFGAAARDAPGWADPHYSRGVLLQAAGRVDDARREFAAASERAAVAPGR